MGGGMFGTPLYLNPKCLVFSAFVLIVYWMPHAKAIEHKIVVAFILATAAYILMAWYDYWYDCTDRLGPTFLGWLSKPFKPQEYGEKYKSLPIKYQKIVRTVDVILLVGILVLVFSPYYFFSRK